MGARISLESVSGQVHHCYICLKTDKDYFFAHKIKGKFDHHVHQECLISRAQEKKRYFCLECQKPFRKAFAYPLDVDVIESLKLGLISSTVTTIFLGFTTAAAIICFKGELPEMNFLLSIGNIWSPLVATNSVAICAFKRWWIDVEPPHIAEMNHRKHKALLISKT